MKKVTSLLLFVFLVLSIGISQDKSTTVKFKVKGVTCDYCLEEVKEALINVSGVNSVEFEETNRIYCVYLTSGKNNRKRE